MMNAKILANGILRAIGVLVLISISLYFLFLVQSVILYLIVAFILTLIGTPILTFFKRRLKFNNNGATVATLFIFIMIISGFVMMFVPLIIAQGANLSLLNTAEIEKDTLELVNQIVLFLKSHHIDAPKMLSEANISSKLNFDFIPNLLNIILGTITDFGIGLASVLFITFFFLKDRSVFLKGARKLIPDNQEDKILNSLGKINHLLTRYFIGLLIQLFIVFVLYLIVLLIFGVESPIVIAFICAVLNIIPYVGPLIASVLAAILTMIGNLNGDFQTQTLPLTIYVLLGFWIVQIIDNNVCQPIIFSKSVSSHPLEIFLVILIAGFLFGILGMIVAVPLFTILKVFGKEFFPDNTIIKLLTKNI